jgi:hypothetical protein
VAGVFRKIGDERVPVMSRAWIESFPENGLER